MRKMFEYGGRWFSFDEGQYVPGQISPRTLEGLFDLEGPPQRQGRLELFILGPPVRKAEAPAPRAVFTLSGYADAA
jgi:hypothetical protein